MLLTPLLLFPTCISQRKDSDCVLMCVLNRKWGGSFVLYYQLSGLRGLIWPRRRFIRPHMSKYIYMVKSYVFFTPKYRYCTTYFGIVWILKVSELFQANDSSFSLLTRRFGGKSPAWGGRRTRHPSVLTWAPAERRCGFRLYHSIGPAYVDVAGGGGVI